jgi:flagellar biosynthesis/type III secretory pathway protein FliH
MASDIRLAISVDASGAVKSIQQFNEELGKTPAQAKSVGQGVDYLKSQMSQFASTLAGGAGLGAGFAIGATAANAFLGALGAVASTVSGALPKLLKYADTIQTTSDRLGIGTRALQFYNYVAANSGTSLEAVAKASGLLSVAVTKGDEAFSRLGLSVDKLRAMSPEAMFSAVGGAIGAIENGTQRAAAALAIFGRGAAQLIPMFSADMKEAAARALGLILSDEVIAASEALGDRVSEVGMAFDAFVMRMASAIGQSPAFAAAVSQLGTMFGNLSRWVEANQVTLNGWVKSGLSYALDGVNALAEGLKLLVVGFFAVAQAVQQLWSLTGGAMFSKLFGFDIGKSFASANLGAIMGKMLEPIEAFQKNVVSAANAVDAADATFKKSSMFGGGSGGSNSFGAAGKAAGKSFAEEFMEAMSEIPRGAAALARAVRESIAQGATRAGFAPGITTEIGGVTVVSGSVKPIPLEMPGIATTFDYKAMQDRAFLSGSNTDNLKTSSFNAAQALQNLANVASVSGSKFGKAIAAIAGGGAGIAGGLGSLFGTGGMAKTNFGTGVTGLLGKLGTYGQIASSALSIGSALFGLFKKKPKEPPPEPPKQATAEAWRNFTGDQLSKGAAGVLAGVSGIAVTTPEQMADQASIASMVFWQTWKDKGLIAAAEAFAPIRDKMLEKFKAAGASDETINALLGPMSEQIDLAGNTAFKGAAEGSKGFADALASMANSQIPMSIEQFRAFERQAVSGYEQMKQAALDQGMTMDQAMKNALMSSGTYLTTLKDAAAKYGFSLDGSQGLFDEAQKAGIGLASSSEERLILSLDALTTTLGGAPPKFEQAFTQAAKESALGGSREDLSRDRESGMAQALESGYSKIADAVKALADRPVFVESTITTELNMDGSVIAGVVARQFEEGGPGGEWMRDAMAGRG